MRAALSTAIAGKAEPAANVPVSFRRLALGILTMIAAVFALSWAQRFFIPLVLGVMIAYTLNPLVVWMERIRIRRMAGTTLVMVGVLSGLAFGTYSLHEEIQAVVDQLPAATSKLSTAIANLQRDPIGNLQKVQTAATTIENVTKETTAPPPPISENPAQHVVIDQPAFKLSNLLWEGSMNAVGWIGEIAIVVFLVFFLLLSGDTFRRKLVRVMAPSISEQRTVRILDDINASLQRYVFVLLITNVLVGLLTWIGFRWIGLENAGAWAVAAGLLHIIPYIGPIVTAAVTGMAAYMQFDALSPALLVSGVSLTVATIVGVFITTWMNGAMAHMNKAALFVSLLFWGWLWGIWGMLLSVPIIVIVKVVSQHVGRLNPVAELLGE